MQPIRVDRSNASSRWRLHSAASACGFVPPPCGPSFAKIAVYSRADLQMCPTRPPRQPSKRELQAYELLGLKPGARLADLKAAYRRLAKVYHPDSNAVGEDGMITLPSGSLIWKEASLCRGARVSDQIIAARCRVRSAARRASSDRTTIAARAGLMMLSCDLSLGLHQVDHLID